MTSKDSDYALYTPEQKERLKQRCWAKFSALFPWYKDAAKALGYALLSHGSLQRDIDLVAVPWTPEAAAPEALHARFIEVTREHNDGIYIAGSEAQPIGRPHGRICWTWHLGGGPYVDLSVIAPRSPCTCTCPCLCGAYPAPERHEEVVCPLRGWSGFGPMPYHDSCPACHKEREEIEARAASKLKEATKAWHPPTAVEVDAHMRAEGARIAAVVRATCGATYTNHHGVARCDKPKGHEPSAHAMLDNDGTAIVSWSADLKAPK